jgi:hypothetical protein
MVNCNQLHLVIIPTITISDVDYIFTRYLAIIRPSHFFQIAAPYRNHTPWIALLIQGLIPQGKVFPEYLFQARRHDPIALLAQVHQVNIRRLAPAA